MNGGPVILEAFADINQALQFIVWLVALWQFILAFYMLVLNAWHTTTRHTFGLLLMLAVGSFSLGGLFGALTLAQANAPMALMAMTAPALQPLLLITAIVVFKPDLLQIWKGWLRRTLYILTVLPFILTLIDLGIIQFFGGAASRFSLWYTGLVGIAYTGGYVPGDAFTNGLLDPVITLIYFILLPILTVLFLLYISLPVQRVLDRFMSRSNRSTGQGAADSVQQPVPTLPAQVISPFSRRMAPVLLGAYLLSSAFNFVLSYLFYPGVNLLISSVLLTAAYIFIVFLQRISERHMQRGSLQFRLTALVLAIALPLLAGLGYFVTDRARLQFEKDAEQNLASINISISSSVSYWFDDNLRALNNLALTPDIISMDPALQQPMLDAIAATYPDLSLVSVIDAQGMNTARSDQLTAQNYSSSPWFKQALQGVPLSYDVIVGRNIWQPDMVATVPVRDAARQVVGVAMFTTSLNNVAKYLQSSRLGLQGVSFIIDQQNRLIAHSDWERQNLAGEAARTQYALTDMSAYPTVAALRQGVSGSYQFTDEDGMRWWAHLNVLGNRWAVVVQQPENELLVPVRSYQGIARLMTLLGALLLFSMIWYTIRQVVQPVRSLTDVANTVAQGDLSRLAVVESEDELGLLANTFNSMTAQLRDLIAGLESRVAERSQALQRRANQLQVTAEVAREAATIHDLETLLENVARLISERFGFYHAGIFLNQYTDSGNRAVGVGKGGLDDKSGEAEIGVAHGGYAILRAASSEGGKRMLARQHRLKIGEMGIVGYVAGSAQPRIALDVGTDAVFFNNPDLPSTRSEMALPLKVRGKVIGVLDVQSNESSAFTAEDLDSLQILADQIAVAIENTRLLAESEQAVRQLQTVYGAQLQERWKERLKGQKLVYMLDASGGVKQRTAAVNAVIQPALGDVLASPTTSVDSDAAAHVARAEIELRGQRLGTLVLRRSTDRRPWSRQEKELIEETVSQVALALENARLLEEIQQRAFQEEMISQIIATSQTSLNLETVMRTAVKEVGQAVNASRVRIRLGNPESDERGDGGRGMEDQGGDGSAEVDHES